MLKEAMSCEICHYVSHPSTRRNKTRNHHVKRIISPKLNECVRGRMKPTHEVSQIFL